MRLCFHCLRWRAGDSQRCPYCGWTRRKICPSGHENPNDANVCGICGSGDLSQCAPSPRLLSMLRICLKAAFWIVLIVVSYQIITATVVGIGHGIGTRFILAIAFLLVALRISSRILGINPGKMIVRVIWKLTSRRR